MAAVAVVTLPRGVSVVLISISSLKIARASSRSSADVVGSGLWPMATGQTQAASARNAINQGNRFRHMSALYRPSRATSFPAMDVFAFAPHCKSIYRGATT
jgi:hypothetical protein